MILKLLGILFVRKCSIGQWSPKIAVSLWDESICGVCNSIQDVFSGLTEMKGFLFPVWDLMFCDYAPG